VNSQISTKKKEKEKSNLIDLNNSLFFVFWVFISVLSPKNSKNIK